MRTSGRRSSSEDGKLRRGQGGQLAGCQVLGLRRCQRSDLLGRQPQRNLIRRQGGQVTGFNRLDLLSRQRRKLRSGKCDVIRRSQRHNLRSGQRSNLRGGHADDD
ncbi:hypothetical protein GBK02_14120 [Dechloromonas sp. TW-R-39-2]|nr:hypothetical protein [Dechloromonas sp. TW-R-39-2]QRM20439.1 hypothetical protein GBK02_14120 [Dechloromonas sp. TW-R-39-2]